MPDQETERAAFLLAAASRLMGAWHVALPGSPAAARRAAVSYLGFVASLPAGDGGALVHCPPVSPAEKACTCAVLHISLQSCCVHAKGGLLQQSVSPSASHSSSSGPVICALCLAVRLSCILVMACANSRCVCTAGG